MAESESGKPTNLTLSSNQLELLQQLLSQTKIKSDAIENPKPTASLAKQGIPTQSLLSHRLTMDSWIIDTGASNHMIGLFKVLSSAYEPCEQGITISMADSTTSLAYGKRDSIFSRLNPKICVICA